MADRALFNETENGRTRLLNDESGRRLLKVLRLQLQTITTNIYIVRWTPEQAEDIYEVLVDGTSVVYVELPRGHEGNAVVQVMSLEEYRPRVATYTKPERRKFAMAVQLATQT